MCGDAIGRLVRLIWFESVLNQNFVQISSADAELKIGFRGSDYGGTA